MTLSKLKFLIRGKRKKVKNFSVASSAKIQQGVELKIGKSCQSIEVGHRTEIRKDTLFEADGILRIGERCVIGFSNWFQCSGEIIIENGVILGPHVNVVASDHAFGSGIKVGEAKLKRGHVRIEKNVWISAGVTIASGVTIGENSVIGANSFVREDVPANSVYGGVPAKKLKSLVAQ